MKNTGRSNKQFWIFNTIGWLVYMTSAGFFYTYMQGYFAKNTVYLQILAFVLIVIACYFVRQFIKVNNLLKQAFSLGTIVSLLFLTFLIALTVKFMVSLYMMYGLHMYSWHNYSIKILILSSFQLWVGLIGWTLFYFVIKIMQHNKQAEIEKWQLQTALKEAELLSLKAQLNPHFIFNCLNNIRAIAIDDGKKTRQMITHLSEILKYTFKFNKEKMVSLKEEITYIKNYLLLESIQLEERLQYSIAVPENLNSWEIPPMSIQLMVENAIKHGIMLLENGGKIQINIYYRNQDLIIDVINDGVLQENQTQGIGLGNLKKRMSMLLSKGS